MTFICGLLVILLARCAYSKVELVSSIHNAAGDTVAIITRVVRIIRDRQTGMERESERDRKRYTQHIYLSWSDPLRTPAATE